MTRCPICDSYSCRCSDYKLRHYRDEHHLSCFDHNVLRRWAQDDRNERVEQELRDRRRREAEQEEERCAAARRARQEAERREEQKAQQRREQEEREACETQEDEERRKSEAVLRRRQGACGESHGGPDRTTGEPSGGKPVKNQEAPCLFPPLIRIDRLWRDGTAIRGVVRMVGYPASWSGQFAQERGLHERVRTLRAIARRVGIPVRLFDWTAWWGDGVRVPR